MNFFAQSAKCDAATENEVRGEFLNDKCDCDVWERWVCCRCAVQEREMTAKYQRLHCSDGPDKRPEVIQEEMEEEYEGEYDDLVREWDETQVLPAHQQTYQVS